VNHSSTSEKGLSLAAPPLILSNHSEADVFFDRPARRLNVALQIVSGACTEELHAECNDLDAVLLRSSIRGLPRSRPHAPFDVDLAAFIQILCAGLRQLSEDYDIVPVDALLFLSLFIQEHVVGRDRETRHRCATVGT
jgi:hypothetical protein